MAIDFVILDDEGNSCKGVGLNLEDHYIYNMDILAVANGEVVTVIDGVPDNKPGRLNPHSYSGNTVIIKHAEREFSAYMHLRNNSVKVKPKQVVKAGFVIGSVGNSGTSTGPHLHFQMMNSDVAYEATGFPVYFSDVVLCKKNKIENLQNYNPIRGDFIISKQ